MVLKGFVDLESKGRHRHIDTTAGKRRLDRAGGVTKLPTTDLKNIPMFVAPAEGHLQRGMQLRKRRLFADHEPPSDRGRYALQSDTELHCTHLVLRVHRLTLTPMSTRLKPRSSTRNGPLSFMWPVPGQVSDWMPSGPAHFN